MEWDFDFLAVNLPRMDMIYGISKICPHLGSIWITKDRLEFSPGEEYVYKGPVPKRMTAERLMDTIWGLRDQPNQAEASDHSQITLPDSAKITKIGKVSAKWIWAWIHKPGKSLRTSIELKTNRHLPLCLRPVTMHSVLGKWKTAHILQRMDRPAYHEVRIFQNGKNLNWSNAEMFGGSSGFIAHFPSVKKREQWPS